MINPMPMDRTGYPASGSMRPMSARITEVLVYKDLIGTGAKS
jgi:hypothetical protein